MQMLRVCACHTYADAWHMDMSCLYSFSSFSVKIRKKLVPDLPVPLRRSSARKHKMHYSVRRIIYYMLCYSLFS